MHSLADALDRFNRKERYLLVRAMLAEGRLPPLCKPFCDQVAEKLGFPIPETAWWATDYHISWLAGALALFVKGEEAARIWPNPEVLAKVCYALDEKTDNRRLVERNSEDVDLVIATGCKLVFIEAKAYGFFSNSQLKHKLARLELLHNFYIGMKPPPEYAVDFHFLITSPKKPTSKLTTCWPRWACKGQDIPWIPLQLPTPRDQFYG